MYLPKAYEVFEENFVAPEKLFDTSLQSSGGPGFSPMQVQAICGYKILLFECKSRLLLNRVISDIISSHLLILQVSVSLPGFDVYIFVFIFGICRLISICDSFLLQFLILRVLSCF